MNHWSHSEWVIVSDWVCECDCESVTQCDCESVTQCDCEWHSHCHCDCQSNHTIWMIKSFIRLLWVWLEWLTFGNSLSLALTDIIIHSTNLNLLSTVYQLLLPGLVSAYLLVTLTFTVVWVTDRMQLLESVQCQSFHFDSAWPSMSHWLTGPLCESVITCECPWLIDTVTCK